MKQIFCFILILLASLPALAQGRPSSGICQYEIFYDRSADETLVQCENLIPLGEAPAGMTVHLSASFHGKEPNETAKFWFALCSNKSVPTRHTPPAFRGVTTIKLSLDAGEIDIPIKDYKSEYYELIRSHAETARAEVEAPNLQKLLDAKTLRGTWGMVEFKFSSAALASLKKFLMRHVLVVQTN